MKLRLAFQEGSAFIPASALVFLLIFSAMPACATYGAAMIIWPERSQLSRNVIAAVLQASDCNVSVAPDEHLISTRPNC
jgi:hypothetical protein